MYKQKDLALLISSSPFSSLLPLRSRAALSPGQWVSVVQSMELSRLINPS